MSEERFNRGDVLAQIGVSNILFIVKSIEKDGYTCDYYINGTRNTVVLFVRHKFQHGLDAYEFREGWSLGQGEGRGR